MMADVYLPCSDHAAVRSPVPAVRATLEHPDNESVCMLGDILVFAHVLLPSLKLCWKKSPGLFTVAAAPASWNDKRLHFLRC